MFGNLAFWHIYFLLWAALRNITFNGYLDPFEIHQGLAKISPNGHVGSARPTHRIVKNHLSQSAAPPSFRQPMEFLLQNSRMHDCCAQAPPDLDFF